MSLSETEKALVFHSEAADASIELLKAEMPLIESLEVIAFACEIACALLSRIALAALIASRVAHGTETIDRNRMTNTDLTGRISG